MKKGEVAQVQMIGSSRTVEAELVTGVGRDAVFRVVSNGLFYGMVLQPGQYKVVRTEQAAR